MIGNTSWFKKRPREEEDDMDLEDNSWKISRMDGDMTVKSCTLPGGWPATGQSLWLMKAYQRVGRLIRKEWKRIY